MARLVLASRPAPWCRNAVAKREFSTFATKLSPMAQPRLDFESEAWEAIAVRGTILVVLVLLGSAAIASAQGTGSSTPSVGGQPAAGSSSTSPAPAPDPANSGAQVQPASESPYDAQAQDVLKKLTARQFDVRLPGTGLLDWFAGLIGQRAQIEWTTAECGDEGSESDSTQSNDTAGASPGGSSSANNADVTLCSEGQALFYGPDGKPSLDRYVVLQLWVGTRRLGVNPDPAHYGSDALSIFVFDGNNTRTLTRLGDLPALLSAMN
jgi:hypothetical protein